MKYEITMKDHHVALSGEIDSYMDTSFRFRIGKRRKFRMQCST